MPTLVPNRFLVRIAHPCPYIAGVPNISEDAAHLVNLPESAKLESYSSLDDRPQFADVRIGWNETGLAFQIKTTGKERLPTGDVTRPGSSDGLTLWIDTRDARTSHRASRYCHQFHFLPNGGDSVSGEPSFVQSKINRALQDAPMCDPSTVLLKCDLNGGSYQIEAFIPANAMSGYDPDQHPRLGIYYHVRDSELGDQFLAVGSDFPIADDPSLWDVLELVKPAEPEPRRNRSSK